MKRLLFLLVTVCLLLPKYGEAQASERKPLKDAAFDLEKLGFKKPAKYVWMVVTRNGGKRESKEYAEMVVSNRREKDGLVLHDTLTLMPSLGGTVFERQMKFPKGSLLHPEQMTLDIKSRGKSVRQMTYERGQMTAISFSGTTNSEAMKFDEGILAFNTLLRLAPQLPRKVGSAHTFQLFAEPVLFRIHKAKAGNESFSVVCEAVETLEIRKKPQECVKFAVKLEASDGRMDFWVGKSDVVVRFVITLPDGGADLLEATLQD